MTVFGRLFKARDKPRNALNGSGYSFFFGNTASGKAVNERSAMQTSRTMDFLSSVRASESARRYS